MATAGNIWSQLSTDIHICQQLVTSVNSWSHMPTAWQHLVTHGNILSHLAADCGVALGVQVCHLEGGAEGVEGAGALAAGRRAQPALEAALLAEPEVEVSRFKFQWVRIRIRNCQKAENQPRNTNREL